MIKFAGFGRTLAATLIVSAALAGATKAQDVTDEQVKAARAAIDAIGATNGFDNILPGLAVRIKATLVQASPNHETEINATVDEQALALAPRRAAGLYGLEILGEDVEDEHNNTTRFVVLAREPHEPPPGNGPVITSFVFRVRNVPAALYKALGGFATNGVNMTKLESYQLGGTFLATEFYADVEGHPADTPLRLALEELTFFSSSVRVLGTYPASPFRLGAAADAAG